jgi:hypothetical protein
MHSIKQLRHALIITTLILSISSCANQPNPEWLTAIPESAVVLNIEGSTSKDDILRTIGEFIVEPLIIRDYIGIDFGASLKASALIPESVDKVSPLWVVETDLNDRLPDLNRAGWTQTGRYKAEGGYIHQFQREGNTLSASQMGIWLVLSTRSNPVEQSLLTRSGKVSHFEETGLTGLHVNVSQLGRLFSPLTAPVYRAALRDVFAGLGVLHVDTDLFTTSENSEFVFKIPFKGVRSPLVSYIEAKQVNPGIIFQVPMGMSVMLHLQDPIGQIPYDSLRTFQVDSPDMALAIEQLMSIMDPQVRLYVQEGASGNIAWVRKADSTAAKNIFEILSTSGIIQKENGIYRSRSQSLGRAIGTHLNTINTMMIGLGNNEIIISSDQTLVNRLMDVPPTSMRELSGRLPQFIDAGSGQPASAFWVDLNKLLTTARSAGWLMTNTSIPPLLQSISELGSRIHVGDGALYVHLKVNRSNTTQANEEFVLAWQYPLRGESIVAVPRVVELAGRKTVILTTDRGRVMGFNTEGSLIFDQNAGSSRPIDGALSYDWFGNKSPLLFQAAGNSIYAWSPTGSLVPRFPFVFEAIITAPILITDSNKDEEPEIVVATEDQRLHMINREGKSLDGWPVSTNGVIRSRPEVSLQNDRWQVRVNSENSYEIFNLGGDEIRSSSLEKSQEEVPDTLNGLPTNSPFLNFAQARLVPYPLSIDLDNDGIQELIIVYDGQIRCYRIQRSTSIRP